MQNLDDWANGRRPNDLTTQAEAQSASALARATPLTASSTEIDIERFMGRWYVIANIPSAFDKGTINNIEEYTWDPIKRIVKVNFFYGNSRNERVSVLKQKAVVKNAANTEWAISPKIGLYLPVAIPYLIVDCADDYSSTIIGVPDRTYLWIMTRDPHPEASVVDGLLKKSQLLGYDIGIISMVPQKKICDVAPENDEEMDMVLIDSPR